MDGILDAFGEESEILVLSVEDDVATLNEDLGIFEFEGEGEGDVEGRRASILILLRPPTLTPRNTEMMKGMAE